MRLNDENPVLGDALDDVINACGFNDTSDDPPPYRQYLETLNQDPKEIARLLRDKA